jgi:hypothetical protein
MDALTDVLRSERSVAGAMLVLIAVLIPASGFVGTVGLPMDIWGMPLERKLRTIAEHPLGWRALNTWLVIALVLSSLGLAAVARQLRGSELGHIAELASLAYVFGALLWTVELVARLSVVMAAADETVATGVVPVWAAPLSAWGSGLFIVYAMLSNLAVLGLGMTLLRSDLVPSWAGWSAAGMSVLLLALLAITRDNIPALNLIGPVVIGVALLLPRA